MVVIENLRVRLLNLSESLQTSFWFIPALMVFLAIGLSFIMLALDRSVDLDTHLALDLLYSGGPEGARSVLSTIAASAITVAGIAFSITIVALTLASSQFGPRLLRNFMKDKANQVVLGTFVSTFIYCLLVLGSVPVPGAQIAVPRISVAFAMVLALANIGVIIYFIHHISTSIQADRVIADVYQELSEHMQRLFPEELGSVVKVEENGESGLLPEEEGYPHTQPILAAQDGYLQAIVGDGLVEIAKQNEILIHIQLRPGEFVVSGSTLAKVKSRAALDESLDAPIANSFIVGRQRSPEQDAEFAIHQLVEVAIRALSPGVNDPYTAISCIDRLGAALCFLTYRAFPSARRCDEEGDLRVIARPVTFAGITEAAFDQIRQYGRSSVAVTIRLMETLETTAAHSRTVEQQQAILRQARMIRRGSQESLSEENDKQDVEERYQALLELLDERE